MVGEEVITVCSTTTKKIASFSKTDTHETLIMLMEWYGVNSLKQIPETAALEFLAMLESGEIKV